jgi:sugar/nucleoside kinase (ribokinase family)
MFTPATSGSPIDYLTVGHVCYDLTPDGRVVGGAAAYTAAVAHVLGCRAAIVTSGARDDAWSNALPGVVVRRIDAPATTVFENIDGPTGRVQTIHALAGRLTASDIPPSWSRAPMVHLGPIADELDPAMIRLFSNSVIGVGPQGWMRRWDVDGRVYQVNWEAAADVLPLAAVVFISIEDLIDTTLLETYARLSRLLVITDGPNGCTVYFHNETRAFPAPAVHLVDATGAGDIFAAAFLVRFYQTDGNIWEAAEFANQIAACSVTRRGLPAKMEAIGRLMTARMSLPAAGQ